MRHHSICELLVSLTEPQTILEGPFRKIVEVPVGAAAHAMCFVIAVESLVYDFSNAIQTQAEHFEKAVVVPLVATTSFSGPFIRADYTQYIFESLYKLFLIVVKSVYQLTYVFLCEYDR